MKKFLCLLLAAVLAGLLILPCAAAEPTDFTDRSTIRNYNAVRMLADLGLVAGYSDGSFGPDKLIRREEVAKLMALLADADAEVQGQNAPVPFYDVSESWALPFIAYGCSLGGSFVGLLAARRNIHMDYGILGSSDLDQTSPLAAKLQTNLLLPLLYPVIRDGKIKSRLLQKRLEKRKSEMGGYVQAFMEMLGGARLYVTMQSCKNQFYSDLVTPLPDKIDVPGTEIHIFYALKMGEKYRARYEQHFARPVIHEQDLQHEELLACYPERWAQLVKDIMEGKQ